MELEDADVRVIRAQCDTELPTEAVQLLQSLRDQGVQGIAVCALQDQMIEQALRKMKEDGIPVVTFNTDLPGSGRDLFVGEDIRQSGRLAAQMMSKCVRPGEKMWWRSAIRNSMATSAHGGLRGAHAGAGLPGGGYVLRGDLQ